MANGTSQHNKIAATRISKRENAPHRAGLKPLGQACAANSLANSDAQKWLQWFQTARFTFKLLPTKEAREFETIAIRQRAAHLYSMISYTPVQWVYKIIQMKKDRRF